MNKYANEGLNNDALYADGYSSLYDFGTSNNLPYNKEAFETAVDFIVEHDNKIGQAYIQSLETMVYEE